jgi:hypothetical protein
MSGRSGTGPDRVAARAPGVGIGLVSLMLTWLIGSRLAALVWPPPTGPTVAFVAAIGVGILVSAVAAAVLSRRGGEPRPRS